jgi:hypothetical protein
LDYRVSSRFAILYQLIPVVFLIVFIILAIYLPYDPEYIRSPFRLWVTYIFFIAGIWAVYSHWHLVKIVRIVNDRLLISSLFRTIDIPASEIAGVEIWPDRFKERIRIVLENETIFGKEIMLIPGIFRAKKVAKFLRRYMK